MRIGNKQLELLDALGLHRFRVVPDYMTRSLVKKGLMKVYGPKGGIIGLTSNGLRALADAADDGRISLAPSPEMLKPSRKP